MVSEILVQVLDFIDSGPATRQNIMLRRHLVDRKQRKKGVWTGYNL
jgi:hypothetical protein